MGQMELEVKILDIDKENFIHKIEALGAKLIEKSNQILFTYDLPKLYGRYIFWLPAIYTYEGFWSFLPVFSTLIYTYSILFTGY